MRDHLMPPKYLLEKVSDQAQKIADDRSTRVRSPSRCASFRTSISEADRKQLREEIESAVKNEVAPAYAKFAKFVREDYAPHGRLDPGEWALPDGEARYRFAVRHQTTTDFTAEQIHQLGLKSVAEIEDPDADHRQGTGIQRSEIVQRAHLAGSETAWPHPVNNCLTCTRIIATRCTRSCRNYSDVCRRTSCPWSRWSRTAAPLAPPADYSIGAGDGSRPGRINVNEYAPEKRLLLNVEAIAYHEGVPGHHLQFSIAQELTGLPPFRKFNLDLNAYTEGWAFYSERLGKEVGFYQDPYSEYGRLQNEMWRAVRWVVDTGVHSQHWTRQQMVDYFHDILRWTKRISTLKWIATSRGRRRHFPTKWDR
jgi:uncharacterized protein (DUF885 family)